MKASDFLDWDEDELEPETEEEVFGQLVKAIANNEGAGWFFVQCSRGQEEDVVARLRGRFGRVSVMELDRESVSVYPEAVALLEAEDFDVLVVRGLDAAILGYEDAKRALGWDDADLHNYDPRDVPQILHHFNQMRECWRDRLLRPVVFVVSPFVVRYLILRCPDFYDWRVSTFILQDPGFEQGAIEEIASLREEELDYLRAYLLEKETFTGYHYPPKEQIERVTCNIRELLDLVNMPPEEEIYLLKLQGDAFKAAKNYDLANSCFRRIIQRHPENHSSWTLYDIHLESLGRSEEAIFSYQKALEIHPTSHLWQACGLIYERLKRYEDAFHSYDRALVEDPYNCVVWLYHGEMLLKLGQYEESVISYQKFIDLDLTEEYISPRYWAFTRIGDIAYERSLYEEALRNYRKASEILVYSVRQTGGYDSWFGLGRVFTALGKYEDAIDSYDQALEFNEDSGEAWYARACASSVLNESSTIADLENAIELSPQYRDLAKGDSCFDSIRHDPRFQALINPEAP